MTHSAVHAQMEQQPPAQLARQISFWLPTSHARYVIQCARHVLVQELENVQVANQTVITLMLELVNLVIHLVCYAMVRVLLRQNNVMFALPCNT